MTPDEIRNRYPDIGFNELAPLFPRMPMEDYPELSGYTWEQVHEGAMGPGGLFLAVDMARLLKPQPGARVLDLGCGHAASSCFLARHYQATVFAVDCGMDQEGIWQKIMDRGLENRVIPLRADARELPFAHGCFDAVFCMDAFHYFGTDEFYLSYLCKFIRPGGHICVGGPCYAHELTEDTPKEWLHGESHAYHSADWWKRHMEKTGLVQVQHCIDHPRGRELWLDDVRKNLEERHPRDREDWTRASLLNDLLVLVGDKHRFSTHFLLLAQKPS